jgi:16S rRNA processing protein RimM
MKYVPVGRVVSAHGVRGEVRFRYYNESSPTSVRYPTFFADLAGKKIELEPLRVRLGRGVSIMKFRGLETAEEVHFLLGNELFVREDDLPPLGPDEYYDYQLIGLAAVTEAGRVVGAVRGVMHTKAHDILVIAGAGEILVPMTEEHILTISREGGFVRVREDALVE